jgi:hypothetical protein
VIPILVGLALGIATIAIFSEFVRSDNLLSDKELIARYSNVPEVKYFMNKYPDAIVSVDRYDYGTPMTSVTYAIDRQVDTPTMIESGSHRLYISVLGQSLHPLTLEIGCGVGGMTLNAALSNVSMIDAFASGCFAPQT